MKPGLEVLILVQTRFVQSEAMPSSPTYACAAYPDFVFHAWFSVRSPNRTLLIPLFQVGVYKENISRTVFHVHSCSVQTRDFVDEPDFSINRRELARYIRRAELDGCWLAAHPYQSTTRSTSAPCSRLLRWR